MIIITGWRSTIAVEFRGMIQKMDESFRADSYDVPVTADRYLFAAGVMDGKRALDITDADAALMLRVNFTDIVRACDRILEVNTRARICIIGSESGYRGSYDQVYAAAKAGIHAYVETTRLRHPQQQLVAIAPTIIEDSGMTRRRTDIERLTERMLQHPKRRYLSAREVAAMAVHLLYVDDGYTTGTVIRMHGGGLWQR